MTDRDERGRLLPGHKGFSKQAQPDQPPDLDASFDDDLIAAANDFGKPRSKVGRRAWCENLRDSRPVEYAQLLTKALARKAEAATNPAAAIPIKVEVMPAPENFFMPAEQAKARFETRTGMTLSDKEPLPPPSKPTLVTVAHKPAFSELDENEFEFGGVDTDDDEPPQSAYIKTHCE